MHSGEINNESNQTSYVERTFSGPATLSFDWRVSGVWNDCLVLYDNNNEQDKICGIRGWSGIDNVKVYTLGLPKWKTGGSSFKGWFIVEPGFESAHSMHSGEINNESNQTSYIERKFEVSKNEAPATLIFDWRVSGVWNDCLVLYDNNNEQDKICGIRGWSGGNHIIKWQYEKGPNSGGSGAWIDNVKVMDPGLENWQTNGSNGKNWKIDKNGYQSGYGYWSMHSGSINPNQFTYIERTFSGPATLSFDWKISGVWNDCLVLYDNKLEVGVNTLVLLAEAITPSNGNTKKDLIAAETERGLIMLSSVHFKKDLKIQRQRVYI